MYALTQETKSTLNHAPLDQRAARRHIAFKLETQGAL